MKTITPEAYAKLTEDEQLDWHPEYASYKEVRELKDEYDDEDDDWYQDICENCGHNRHEPEYVTRTYPIGKPIHYTYRKLTGMVRIAAAIERENAKKLLKSLKLQDAIQSGKPIKFTRYTPLDGGSNE